MRVHDRLHIGADPEKLGVDVEFVRYPVATVKVAATVEVDFTDIVGDGEQQPAILWTTAPQQDPVGIQPDADVPEDVGRQSLLGQDPAGGRDGRVQVGHAIATAGFWAAANTNDLIVTGTVFEG
jgi:hypothetical protein